jgi:hypothetical protein
MELTGCPICSKLDCEDTRHHTVVLAEMLTEKEEVQTDERSLDHRG